MQPSWYMCEHPHRPIILSPRLKESIHIGHMQSSSGSSPFALASFSCVIVQTGSCRSSWVLTPLFALRCCSYCLETPKTLLIYDRMAVLSPGTRRRIGRSVEFNTEPRYARKVSRPWAATEELALSKANALFRRASCSSNRRLSPLESLDCWGGIWLANALPLGSSFMTS